MIPVYFDVPATTPEQKREHDAWFQHCIDNYLPEIVAREEKELGQSAWEVTIDFCHVFHQLCDSHYGKRTHVQFHPDGKYYAFVGQLMSIFSELYYGRHGSFSAGYDDAPILKIETIVLSMGSIKLLASDVEKLLPAYRNFVTQTLPSLSVDVMNLDTGEEIRA